MKKSIALCTMISLLMGCSSQANTTVENTPDTTGEPIVYENIGIQIIHSGYRTVTESVYIDQGTTIKTLRKQDPDQKKITNYNFSGNPIKTISYELVEGEEVLTSYSIYTYAENGTLIEVTTRDENHETVMISIHNEDGSWTDTDPEGNVLESSIVRDQYGNMIRKQTDEGYSICEYNQNGDLTKITNFNHDETWNSETEFVRYVNDHLADTIIEKTEEDTKTLDLIRGKETNGIRLSYYKSGNETVVEIQQEIAENGLTEVEIVKANQTIVTIYTYE